MVMNIPHMRLEAMTPVILSCWSPLLLWPQRMNIIVAERDFNHHFFRNKICSCGSEKIYVLLPLTNTCKHKAHGKSVKTLDSIEKCSICEYRVNVVFIQCLYALDLEAVIGFLCSGSAIIRRVCNCCSFIMPVCIYYADIGLILSSYGYSTTSLQNYSKLLCEMWHYEGNLPSCFLINAIKLNCSAG